MHVPTTKMCCNKIVRFQVVKAVSVKMTPFKDIASHSLVNVDLCFRCAYYCHHQGDHPDNGGSKHL